MYEVWVAGQEVVNVNVHLDFLNRVYLFNLKAFMHYKPTTAQLHWTSK